MKILIVDDDYTCTSLLQDYLSPYGECDVAHKGIEAIEAFNEALKKGKPYDLICLDVMMPEMDGHQTLKAIHGIEKKFGKAASNSVKVIMISTLTDTHNIIGALGEGCTSYIIKPVDEYKIIKELKSLGFIDAVIQL